MSDPAKMSEVGVNQQDARHNPRTLMFMCRPRPRRGIMEKLASALARFGPVRFFLGNDLYVRYRKPFGR